MQYSNNILEKYESRPRKWWLYTLIVFILSLIHIFVPAYP